MAKLDLTQRMTEVPPTTEPAPQSTEARHPEPEPLLLSLRETTLNNFRLIATRALIRFVEFRTALFESGVELIDESGKEFERLADEVQSSDETLTEIRERVSERICRLVDGLALALASVNLPSAFASDGLEYDLTTVKDDAENDILRYPLWTTGHPERLLKPSAEIAGLAVHVENSSAESVANSITGMIADVDFELPAGLERRLRNLQSQTTGKLFSKLDLVYKTMGGVGALRIVHSTSFELKGASFAFFRLELEASAPELAVYGEPDPYDAMKSVVRLLQTALANDNPAMKVRLSAYRIKESSLLPGSIEGPMTVELAPDRRAHFVHFAAELIKELGKRSHEPLSPYVDLFRPYMPNSRKYWDAILQEDMSGTLGGFIVTNVLGIQPTESGFRVEDLKRHLDHSFDGAALIRQTMQMVLQDPQKQLETLTLAFD